MLKWKTIGKTLFALFLIIAFTKQLWYYHLFSYHLVSQKDLTILDESALILSLNKLPSKDLNSIEELLDTVNKFTAKTLSFSSRIKSQNPNDLLQGADANCIGYSAVFNSVATHLIRENNLTSQYEAKHLVGEIHFLGINIHSYFNSSFFANHDFNSLTEVATGKVLYSDPTLFDYLRIGKVKCYKKANTDI